MQDDTFEWDDAEAASDWRDHGISFEMAREGSRMHLPSSELITGTTTARNALPCSAWWEITCCSSPTP
jgi:hypothetical protein